MRVLYIDNRAYGHNIDLHIDFISYLSKKKYMDIIPYGKYMNKYLPESISPNMGNVKAQLDSIVKKKKPDLILTYNCNGSSYEIGADNVQRYRWVEDFIKNIDLPKFHVTTDYCRSGFRQDQADWFSYMGYSASLFRHKVSLNLPIEVDKYWLPFSVDEKLYKKHSIKDISKKSSNVGFIGASYNSSRDLYRNRIAAIKFLTKKSFIEQPKMVNRHKFLRQILLREEYVKFLTKNLFGLTCGGTCNYMTAKYFQIPAANSMLVCTDTVGLEIFPKETYISYSSDKDSLANMLSKVKYYLKNKKEAEFKIKILNNYVLKEHSHKKRANGLLKLFKEYV